MRTRVKFSCLLFLQLLDLVKNKLLFSKATDGFVIRCIYNLSLNDCKKECGQRSLCYTINYRRSSKACELNKDIDDLRLQKQVGWIYSEKSSFVDTLNSTKETSENRTVPDRATFSQCNCQDGRKCIVSPQGYTCVIEECETWAAQGRSNVATIGARSEHFCVLDIAKFDATRDSNRYVTPFVCASDGKWSPGTKISSTCYMIAFVLKPNTNTDPYYAWVNGDNTRSDVECLRSQSCQDFYRNSVIDIWNSLPTTKVRFSIFKNRNEEQYVVFNGSSSSYINWFSHARVTESSWSDLVNTATQLEGTGGYFFNMAGLTFDTSNSTRRFYINKLFLGCPGDAGWFSAVFVSLSQYGPCSWERQTSIRYSTVAEADLFTSTAQADKVYVLLDLSEI